MKSSCSGTPIAAARDSLYKPVERPARRKFNSMPVPKKLQAALPFASKPKLEAPKRKGGYLAKRAKAVVLEPGERKQRQLMQALATIRNEKLATRKTTQREKRAKKNADAERDEARRAPLKRAQDKRKFRARGKEEARKRSRTVGLSE